MAGQKPGRGRGKNLSATAQAAKASMLAAVGEGGRSKAQEPVLATPTTRSPAFSGGRRLSTGSGSRSFEFPVVKSQSRGASGSEDQGNVEDTSSSKLAKRSGLKIPGTSRLATPSSRAADAEGAGPSEPAAKRSRISPAFQPCSSALKASDLPDYNRILDGDWSELSTTELMGVVLTESCKVVNRKINNLQPRPRPEALVLLKGRLDRAYLKGSMNIELFQESPDDVYLLPQAAYAASALQDGSAHLDEEIAMLARMEAILDDPKEKEVLFKRMGLGEVEPSSGKAEKGKARNNSPVKGVRVQGGSAGGGGGGGTGDKLFDTLTQVFEVLQYQAEGTDVIVQRCNTLLETVATAGLPKVPSAAPAAGGPAPTTPHTLMLNLAKAVHDGKT